MYNLIFNNDSLRNWNRNSKEAYTNTLTDILLMSECDFFVGTQSSNIGRVVYELMQTKYFDASWRMRSLDLKYFVLNPQYYESIVVQDHIPEQEDEIELKLNDVIIYRGTKNLRKNEFHNLNGYSIGLNKRTSKTGYYPSHKVREVIQTIF